MKIPKEIFDQVLAIDGCEGIIFTGSRQSGVATKDSDWDFYVLLADGKKSFRKTWKYQDTFIEVFCNTLKSIETNEFKTDDVSNPAIRILSTGEIIKDTKDKLKLVQKRAKKIYADGPFEPDDDLKNAIGYTSRAFIDDINSLKELKIDGSYEKLKAIKFTTENIFKLERKWLPKPRYLENDLKQIDKSLFLLYKDAVDTFEAQRIVDYIRATCEKYSISLSGEIYQERK